MGRPRTRKAKMDELESVEDVDSSEKKQVQPKKTHFTVRLMQGTKYELHGMVFRRDVNKLVSMEYYDVFHKNGWFQIVR